MTAIARQGEAEPTAPSAPRAEVLRGLSWKRSAASLPAWSS
jgi:hypothetical protein